MKLSVKFPTIDPLLAGRMGPLRSPRPAAFTLVEMLVGITILSFIIVVLSSIFNLTSNSWRGELIHADDFGKARMVLNVVTDDIERGVFRADVQNFPNLADPPANGQTLSTGQFPTGSSPTYCFYTRMAGAGANSRSVSLVSYKADFSGTTVQAGSLVRAVTPLLWSGTGANQLFQSNFSNATPAEALDDALAPGVLDFEIAFLRADGTRTRTYTFSATPNVHGPVVTLVLSLAVLNSDAMTVLTQNGSSTTLLKKLNQALVNALPSGTAVSPLTVSIKETWDNAMNMIVPAASYPRPVVAGLQTFEYTVPCQPFN